MLIQGGDQFKQGLLTFTGNDQVNLGVLFQDGFGLIGSVTSPQHHRAVRRHLLCDPGQFQGDVAVMGPLGKAHQVWLELAEQFPNLCLGHPRQVGQVCLMAVGAEQGVQ